MTVATYKWTIDRYHQAIAAGILDDRPVELLKGDIVLVAPEREPHAYYNTETAEYLRTLLRDRAKVRDAKPITLPNQSEPAPDIAIAKPLGTVYLECHPYPEDIFWIIEFSHATLSKDLGLKKEIYAEAGIQEYWVVNLKSSQLKVFRDLVDGGYTTELTLDKGTISPLAFQDMQIEVQRLMNP
jgi:Uma2 family endonuclease